MKWYPDTDSSVISFKECRDKGHSVEILKGKEVKEKWPLIRINTDVIWGSCKECHIVYGIGIKEE